MILFLLLLLIPFSVNSEICNHVLTWDASVTPNVDFYRVYDKEVRIGKTELLTFTRECEASEYNITATNLLGIESEPSASFIVGKPLPPTNLNKLPTVAKNRDYPDRPMKDSNFLKTNQRIKIGKPCELKMIKPYSTTDSSRGYFFVTNEAGFRGLVICKK